MYMNISQSTTFVNTYYGPTYQFHDTVLIYFNKDVTFLILIFRYITVYDSASLLYSTNQIIYLICEIKSILAYLMLS